MICPVAGGELSLPGGNYYPNAYGIYNIATNDVPAALAAGCSFAYLSVPVAPSVAAAGTTQATATPLPPLAGQIHPVTGASGTNGVVLSAADVVLGRRIYIANMANAALLIYPPSGGTIGGLAANAAFTSTANHGICMTCVGTSGGGQWAAMG
jgi:hypothetical protein